MRLLLSPKPLPELAELSELGQTLVLLNFQSYRTSSLRFRFAEIGFVAFIILAELAGFIGGWFFWRGFWGSLLGATLAMSFVMAVFYVADVLITRITLQRFLRSEQGKSVLATAKGMGVTD